MPKLFCLKCGYNLTGIEPGKCPECGQWWTPRQIETEHAQVLASAFHDALKFWLAPLVVITVMAAAITSDAVLGNGQAALTLISLPACLLGLIVLDFRLANRMEERQRLRAARDELAPFNIFRMTVVFLAAFIFHILAVLAAWWALALVLAVL